MEKQIKISSWLLRVGIAFAFLYAGISAYIEPINWIGFLPLWLQDSSPIPADTMLTIFLILEIILGLWILSGWKTFYSCIVSALVILLITVSNPYQFIILFRDVVIFFSSLALAILNRQK